MGAHELSRLVRQTLDYLPSLYGDVLEMKYIHGLPVKEIASRLGKGPKAIESLLTRARESFRDGFRSLVGMGPDYLADSGR
jgi:RNA polymerase sigma-70 factor (ECF subfamily)